MNPERAEELLQACLDGTLDEAQERELAQWLREAPEARQRLRSYLQVEGGLLALAKANCLENEPPAPEASSTVESVGRALLPVRRADGQECPSYGAGGARRGTGLRVQAWRWVLGLAASVALLAGWFWFAPHPASPRAIIGQVTEVQGTLEVVSLSGAVRPGLVGEALRAGDTLRTGAGDSYAVIEYADKTRLELSPETVVRLPEDGRRSIQLTQGVLRGNAQVQEQPLVVGTTAAEVRVQGDRFVLSSTGSESVRVDVEAGKAEVVRQDQKSVAVESGGSIFIRAEALDTIVEQGHYVTEPRRVLGFPGAWAVTFPADGEILAASYRELQRFGPGPDVEKVRISTGTSDGRLAAFTRDGKTLLVYRGQDKGDGFILWDVPTRKQLRTIEARVTDRQYFALAPDASWLATVNKDASRFVLNLWDSATGNERTCVTVPTEAHIDCLAAAPSGTLLAAGLVNLGRKEHNSILLLDPVSGEEQGKLPTRAYPLTVIAFSPDGRYLAAGITGQVQLWDVEKRELVRTIRGFERVLSTLAFSPDGQLLAGGTQDGQVWLWDVSRGEEVQVIQAGTSGVRVLAFAPDGRSLITGGIKRQPLMQWDVRRRL